MVKTNKNEKLTEDVLQDQTMAPAVAEPATTQEVADASIDAGMTTEGDVPATDPNMATEPVEDPQPETFTAPVAGMVPSGWINPAELAQAVAQETGDVQAAETAPDVQTAEDPEAVAATTADATMTGEQPLVAEQPVQAQMESLKFSDEEIEMILEYRKYKANKLVEEVTPSEEVHAEDEKEDISAGAPDVVATEPAPMTESDDTCPECGKKPCECGDEKITESEEDIVEDEEVFADEEDILEEVGDEEDVIEDDIDDEEDFEVEDDEDFDTTETDDLLDRINSYLDDDSDEGRIAAEAFDMTADYLDSLFDEDDIDDEDFEDDEEFEDASEEFESVDDDDLATEPDETEFVDDDVDETYDEDFEESTESNDSRLNEDIIYPAGSSPSRRTESFEDADNLVEAYKRESARKREALNSYRNALNGTSRVSETKSSNSNAWSNNRFEEKYDEHSKFDYRELLKNGFLG